jgi:hypothetical protein
MKLGRTHLIASLTMVAASIAYNVWVFTRPARRSNSSTTPAPLIDGLLPSGPVVTGEDTVAAIDPTTLPPPPAVDLERAPEWPRNPFVSTSLRRDDLVFAPVAEPEVDTDVALATILHSAERRLAVVNGKIVRVGDRIGSSTIVDIQPRAIVVESPRGGRRVVELRAVLTKKDSK